MPQIIVDKNKCIGCGSCYAMYPELFAADADGKSKVISSDYQTHGYNKEEIIAVCPVSAISVKE